MNADTINGDGVYKLVVGELRVEGFDPRAGRGGWEPGRVEEGVLHLLCPDPSIRIDSLDSNLNSMRSVSFSFGSYIRVSLAGRIAVHSLDGGFVR